MSERVVQAWMEIVHLPRGRSGTGQPEWQAVIRGRTERGLIRTWWIPHSVTTDREASIRTTRAFAAAEGIEFRSAEVIPFRGRRVA